MSSINTVLLAGKPGSGKGTQARLLVEERGWRHIATGDHLRTLQQRPDSFGRRVRETLATGELLPSWLMTHLLVQTMTGLAPSKGVVLDGFARTSAQANELHDVLTWYGRPYLVIVLDVSDEVAAERMRARTASEERSDSDTPEKIARRLAIFREEFNHVAPRFSAQNVLRGVDAEDAPEKVHRMISGLLR